MLPEKRRQEIVKINIEKEGISIKELAECFNVSKMTILRDIKILVSQSLVEAVRGGIIPINSDQNYNGDHQDDAYDIKKRKSLTEKQQIAKYCANYLIKEGSVISLEGGSTASLIVRKLTNKNKITLITNGLFVLKDAIGYLNETNKVVSTGGILEQPYAIFVGPDLDRFYKDRHIDTVFISCVGFDLKYGPMDSSPLDVQAKRAMVQSANRVVLMVDKNKFDVRSVMSTVDMNLVTDIVTNSTVSDHTLNMLSKYPAKIHLA